MKNKIYSLITASAVLFLSCEKDPETVYETVTVTETVVVTETETVTVEVPVAAETPETQTVGSGGISFIDDSQVWTNDRIWIMDGKVVVRDGGVLTIEAGTIVKAEDGQGVDASALVVAKGGTLYAEGTASEPIVFTAISDNLSYDNSDRLSPNLTASTRGLWGGVILLGKATTGTDTGTALIEGIAAGYTWTEYGGSLDADSSGSLKYVSIRHNGTELGNGDEIQGLTMGGVGSGTTIENIEIMGSNDDGIEIFGGTVNVTNLTIYDVRDDAIDLDQGYAGTITNAAVQLGQISDTAFEIDGTEDSTDVLDGQYTVNGVTVVIPAGMDDDTAFGDWKSDATGANQNIAFTGAGVSEQRFEEIDADTYSGTATANAKNTLWFSSVEIVASTGTAASYLGSGESSDDNTSHTGDSPSWLSVVTTATTGASDLSVMSWTAWYKLTQ